LYCSAIWNIDVPLAGTEAIKLCIGGLGRLHLDYTELPKGRHPGDDKIIADETGRNTLDGECPMFDIDIEWVMCDGMTMRRDEAVAYMKGR
jgi:hypothetical protein